MKREGAGKVCKKHGKKISESGKKKTYLAEKVGLVAEDIFKQISVTKTSKAITMDIERDFFMSAQEAVEYGIIDHIMPRRKK